MLSSNLSKSSVKVADMDTKYMKLLLWRGLPLMLWMGVIFFFSSLPGSPYPFDPPFTYYLERKGAHVFEFALLFILAVRFFSAVFSREIFFRVLLLSSVFSLTYATTDELHQFFVPYRGAKMTDVLIDGTSVLFVACIYYYQAERAKRKFTFVSERSAGKIWSNTRYFFSKKKR